MKESKKAAFGFIKYHIPQFSFIEPADPNSENLNLRFATSGIYSPESGQFRLKVEFTATANDNLKVIDSTIIAIFEFQDKGLLLTDIPPYFYRNALAIVFPYIRAFISSLTLMANVKVLIMPILNLSELEDSLKNNTEME